MEEIMDKFNPYLLITICISATCGLLFGFDTAIIAGAAPFVQSEFAAKDGDIELIVSACALGALFGALCSGRATDKLGRRFVLLITGCIFVVGTLIAAYAPSVMTLIFGRFILGFAIGMGSFTTPLYIAEMAPATSRGKLVLWNGAFLTGGQVIAFLVNYSYTADGDWRMMILSGIVPAVILTTGMMMLPESPKWLASKGRTDDARKVLRKLRQDKAKAEHELSLIVNTPDTQKMGFMDIFQPWLRPVLVIGLVLGMGQQLMGINTVMYYGPYIMKNIGFSSAMTQIFGTLGLGVTNFVFTVVTLLFIDKLGRRKFLLIGSAMAACSLISLIGLLSGELTSTTAYFALASLTAFIIGYCISLGSLFWLLIAEIFPLRARGTCMSFVVAVQWATNFLVSATFLSILNGLGITAAFGLYAVIAMAVFVFVYLKVPETKGVPLEVIEKNIHKGLPSRELGQASENWQKREVTP